MRGNRKIGIYLIATIIIAFITIGFAYLNASLSIVGSSSIKSSSWNVYWDNIQVSDGSVSGSQVTQEPTIDSSKTAVSFNVRLSKPGDFYEFTVDAVNDGTMDVMVDVVTGGIYESNGTTPKELPNYLEYSFTYASGDSIVANDLLKVGWQKKYKIRVHFKEDISPIDLPSTADSFVFKFGASYAQGVIPELTNTIYWALQDTNNDDLYEKLVLSSHQVTGELSGSFAGNTVFDAPEEVPWITDDSSTCKYLKNVEIEGTIVPKSTAYWFYGISHDVPSLSMNLENLVTSRVTNMSNMFQKLGRFDVDFQIKGISKWDTSSVTDMSYMFNEILVDGYEAIGYGPFRIEISEWDTSSVEDMSYMFSRAAELHPAFELDLSKWKTSKVKNMEGIFYSAGRFTHNWSVGDLSEWDTSKVTNMSRMFEDTGSLSPSWDIGDISNWNTSSVTNMDNMFSFAGFSSPTFDLNLSNWDTSKVTSMSFMFSQTGRYSTSWKIRGISKLDTSSVTDMSYMFCGAGESVSSFELDLSKWKTSKVTNMKGLFNGAGEHSTTFELDLTDWDTSKVTNMSYMFSEAGRDALTWNIENLSGLDTSSVTDMSKMFYYAGYNATTFELDLSEWNISSVNDMNSMFYSSGRDSTTWSIGEISSWNTSSVTDMSEMFYHAGENVTTFELDLSDWNTSNVTNMSDMFNCSGENATTFNLDISNWNTSSVTNMARMFKFVGYNATNWSITIPQTNGGGISNTTSTLYGSTTSTKATPPTGKSFTLASS
ncbi:MAG: DUF285 domain-containing protein [Bacilli bacterium]|nr:DUF285 domain-containing protein [Bacilli bacterium]